VLLDDPPHLPEGMLVGGDGAQMAMPRFLVISLAMNPIRSSLTSRCSLEKESSLERFRGTISPSRSDTGRSPISRNLE